VKFDHPHQENDVENRNRNHCVIQHVRPPQPIILGDKVQRSSVTEGYSFNHEYGWPDSIKRCPPEI
jgi:hypothetical protein